MEDPHALNVYTDGSGRHNPRTGGIGVRFIFPDNQNKPIQDFNFDGYKGANSQEMELQACASALQECVKIKDDRSITRIIIHTDSMYLVNGYKKAFTTWPQNGWILFDGKPVLNVDLWKKITTLSKKTDKRIDVQYVQGHSDNVHNKAVDQLAKKSSKQPVQRLTKAVMVRRKTVSKKTEPGSVQMLGQMVMIRIVECQYLTTQRIFRYRYEIVSRRNIFYKKMDFATSYISLRPGHTYIIRFNNDSKNPTIIKSYREVT